MSGEEKRAIVCRCMDITVEDVEKAIEMGYTDFESLRRYLGIGFGPCQGRHCYPLVLRILARKTGKSIDELGAPRMRPPLIPLPAYVLLGMKEAERSEEER